MPAVGREARLRFDEFFHREHPESEAYHRADQTTFQTQTNVRWRSALFAAGTETLSPTCRHANQPK